VPRALPQNRADPGRGLAVPAVPTADWGGLKDCLAKRLGEVEEVHPEGEGEQFGSQVDHVYLVAVIPPGYAVSARMLASRRALCTREGEGPRNGNRCRAAGSVDPRSGLCPLR
jgi:hypothetical protein